ncbi:MAG: ADP-glyceromanno-heptose 6-epimerase [Nitrospinae bacterium CG11_big_fil_rev_8_21_14_0_20_56_8]|nr:MAG: ADP-glyceromanno-heptose 6-epimerase [Nitrospinae bacterium CG11_big_fil_rev_8_21_14_0_20_56_8]
MIIVTGGTGFIGSAIACELNRRGIDDLWIVDHLDHPEKEKNLAALRHRELVSADRFLEAVKSRTLPPAQALFHMGACSSTTETDRAFLRRNNFEYTRHLAEYCLAAGVRFIYASSAATYGNGEQGYEDDESRLDTLRPLNPYGESKQMFDLWARERKILDRIAGLKYFNVYGPNEYHKGDMQSMARKGFFQVSETGKLRLFKSHRPDYADGGQERDFVYIKDAVAMTLFFLDRPAVGGIFNVGSGVARNWNDVARALFHAMGKEPAIEYIDMPPSIRDQYQYHTCAPMGKIRSAGYTGPATSLEDGIHDYVKHYLLPGKRLGE